MARHGSARHGSAKHRSDAPAVSYAVFTKSGRTLGFTNDPDTAGWFQSGGYIVIQYVDGREEDQA